MQQFLFVFKKSRDAESIIKQLIEEGLEFNFKIITGDNDNIEPNKGLITDIIFTDNCNIISNFKKATGNNSSQTRTQQIIVISNNYNSEEENKCLQKGAYSYLTSENYFKLVHTTKKAIEFNNLERIAEKYNLSKENDKQFYKGLIEQAPDAIMRGNKLGEIIEVNTAACILTGYSKDELLSSVMDDLFSKRVLDEKPLQYDLLNKGSSVITERTLTKKDGTPIPIVMNTKLINNESYFCIMHNMIDLNRYKNDLKEKEERMRNIIEHSSNLFYSHNIKGEFSYVSPKTKEFFDCEPDEFISMRSSLFTDNPINRTGKLKTQKAIESGKAQNPFIVELIGKKGRRIWAEVHEKPILNNGKIIGIVGALVDITKRKKTSDKLKSSEEKFRTLFEQAPDGVFLIDESGIIIDCNQAFCNLVDYKEDELLNLHVTMLLIGQGLDKFKDFLHIIKDKGKVEGETNIITKKGNNEIIRISASALSDDNGKYTGAIIQTNDITAKENYRIKIETSEEQLTTLINASPDLICIKDGSGRWLKANNILIERLELTNIDFLNKTNSEIALLNKSYSSHLEQFTIIDEMAWNNHKTTTVESVITSPNGDSNSYEVFFVPIFHQDGKRKVLVLIGRETTQRKKLESQLQHSQKMEAIGLMAGGIAHSFNNILQAIVGYIDFAKDGLDINSQRYEDIEQINQHVNRATLLTRNLMAVGKDQLMDKTEIDINDILRPIVELTNRNKTNNITVEFHPLEDLPSIIADGTQIDQVIMNLFINSADAMPAGGKIIVAIDKVILDDDFCKSNAWAKLGEFIKISIVDTGHGMDLATKQRIFEPYFTTKDRNKGTGLGLSTVFGIISQHNGLINVISDLHKGTTFEIFIPLVN